MTKKKALISACLLGVNCKYNGGNNCLPIEKLQRLMSDYELIPICPEAYGGLKTPRFPAERVGDRVINTNGEDVSEQYEKGAEAAVHLAKIFGAKTAFLKEKSPSCGCGRIYDGSFGRSLTHGDGVTAEKLKQLGITIIGESDI